MNGLYYQVVNEIRTQYRDVRYIILTLLLPLIVYLLADTINRASYISLGNKWQIYLLVAMTSLGLMSTAIGEFSIRISTERSKGWTKMVRLTPLPRSHYLIAKLLSQVSLWIITVIVLFLVASVFLHIYLLPITWIQLAIWLILASSSFITWGFLIGMLGSATQPVATLTLLALAVIGGLIQPINGLPIFISQSFPTFLILDNGLRIVEGLPFKWIDVIPLVIYSLITGGIAIMLDKRKKD